MSRCRNREWDRGEFKAIDRVANTIALYDGTSRDVLVSEWTKEKRPRLPPSYDHLFRNIDIMDKAYQDCMNMFTAIADKLAQMYKINKSNLLQVAHNFYSDPQLALVSELVSLDAYPPLESSVHFLKSDISEAHKQFVRVAEWYSHLAGQIKQVAKQPGQYQRDCEWESRRY